MSLSYKQLSVFIILLFLELACGSLQAASGASSPKAVLIIADYLTLSDLTQSQLPGIKRLVSESGVGLISPGAVGTKSVESNYTSVSAGASCWATSDVDRAYSRFETVKEEPDPAGVIFKRRTGHQEEPDVVHLEIPKLGKDNEDKLARSLPGALADLLAKEGKKTAVFGNSDLSGKLYRRASVIAATGSGAVHVGDVSRKMLRYDPQNPTGFSTDADKLASAIDNALESVDFVVADFGDTTRVELSKQYLSDASYKIHRRQALENLDRFLTELLERRGSSATIILASMAPAYPEKGHRSRLAPIVLREPDKIQGCVISPTTRTPGMVSGFDIAPTVLAGLGVDQPRKMIGGQIKVIPDNENRIQWLDDTVLMNREMTWSVLAGIGAFAIIVATTACLFLVTNKRGLCIANRILRVLLIAAAASPVAMLFSTPGTPVILSYVQRLIIWLVVFTTGAYALSWLLAKILGSKVERLPGGLPIISIAIITALAITVEAFRGGQIARYALITMADFKGYRFYGIGNEYMGVYLAAILVSLVWLRECFSDWHERRIARSAVLVFLAVIIAGLVLPPFGANAGGAMAAVIGLGLAYVSGIRGRFEISHVILMIFTGIAVVAFAALIDLLFTRNAPSHIGLAASACAGNGYILFISTVLRKLSMNIRIMGMSHTRLVMMAAIPFLALWFSVVGKQFDEIRYNRPAFNSGLLAILVGIMAALLFNDSGIVAAGLMFSFLVVSIIYTLMERSEKGSVSQ